MHEDFRPTRHKPKRIEPLEAPERKPLPDLGEPTPDEPIFHTPEEVAEAEKTDTTTASEAQLALPEHISRSWWQSLIKWKPTRKEAIIISAAVILLGGAVAVFAVEHKSPVKAPAIIKTIPKVTKPVVPTTVPSTLTGLPVDPAVNQRPVTGVMLENSPDARPQSGLNQAGVVFEAIAEGGITRFLALFQDTQPDYIGPVRSARPYYVQWDLGFDAGYAHVGGSPEAIADIKAWNVKDLDQFYNSGSYQRISTRYAPHNVYSSAAQLTQLQISKGFTSSKYTGFTRKTDAPSKTPTASSIDLTFSSYYYNVHYDYDATTNTYKRSEGGAAHMELNKDGSQVQIAPKVVLALVMPYSIESDGDHSVYQTIGSGPLYVFQDGVVTQGTWAKSASTSQFTFTGSDNKPIALNAGQTWVSALASTSDVVYK